MSSESLTTETGLLRCGADSACDAIKSLPVISSRFILWIIRGLPGSGKSTLAQILASALRTDAWYEADMYFMVGNEYRFNPQQLGDAHDWCQAQVKKAMRVGTTHIIVSNTCTQLWERDPYIQMAEAYDYDVQTIDCHGHFTSSHQVPEEIITKMRNRWENFNG